MDVYKISGRIGQGAHGIVLRAQHKTTGQEVALKKMNFRRPNGSGVPMHVLREILCLQQVDSEFVVDLLEVITHGLGCVLVFEYMPSGLWEMIHDTQYVLSESEIKRYMTMLLCGVAHLHDLNIMHRDLKPANLLIDNQGILKIADFGLGRLFYRDKKVEYSHQVATRWYRAPELLYGARFYDERIDMWAVGCIFAEMWNGSPLFPGETDIEQLSIVLHTLGTPNEEIWPGLSQLPDYNKIVFPYSAGIPFTSLLPDACPELIDLTSNLLCYNSTKRKAAKEALVHPYFFSYPLPCPIEDLPKPEPDHRRKFYRYRDYNVNEATPELLSDLSDFMDHLEPTDDYHDKKIYAK